MKQINRLLIIFTVALISSCGLTELDLRDSPNEATPETAEKEFFYNAIQRDFMEMFMSVNDQTARAVRQLGMTGGNIYENAWSQTTFNYVWNRAYADLLPDLDALIDLSTTEGGEVPFYAGASKVMKAYVLMTLVDVLGNVPYSEAGQGIENPSPAADDQQSIYNEALALLESSLADFATSPLSVSNDLIYGNDHAKWTALANSLMLKYYVNTRLVNGDSASKINGLVDKVIQDSDGDFAFPFSSFRSFEDQSRDSRHWWYVDGYENASNVTYYHSNYFMWSLYGEKGMEDPRTRYYFYRQDLTPKEDIDAFTLDCVNLPRPLHYTGDYPYCVGDFGYWGRDHGNDDGIPPDTDRRAVAGVYPAGGLFDMDQSADTQNDGADGLQGAGIAPIMMSSFVQFMLAESALTLNTTGSAAEYLEAGIRQSIGTVMDFGASQAAGTAFEPTADDVDAYVSSVMGNFNAASDAGKLDIIMKEYHIATWGNGLEAYNNYRRTGYPSGMQPVLEPNPGTFPRLMYYPADYLNLNANISDQRSLSDQAFWDNNPAGFIN